jgi:hypothetical protein
VKSAYKGKSRKQSFCSDVDNFRLTQVLDIRIVKVFREKEVHIMLSFRLRQVLLYSR